MTWTPSLAPGRWRFFPWMEEGADGWWRLPEHQGLPLGPGSLPLMFSLTARRDAERD